MGFVFNINALPYDQRGVATITSEATTNSGLNLQITEEIVLPSSPGCTISKASQEGDYEVESVGNMVISVKMVLSLKELT